MRINYISDVLHCYLDHLQYTEPDIQMNQSFVKCGRSAFVQIPANKTTHIHNSTVVQGES